MKIFKLAFLSFVLVLALNAGTAFSAERIVQSMKVADAVTLKSGSQKIKLWGIKPVEPENSIYYLRAIDLLEKQAAGKKVNCKTISKAGKDVIARCLSSEDEDLGLALISKGLAVIDRKYIDESEFAAVYVAAENRARLKHNGVWEQATSEPAESFAKDGSEFFSQIKSYLTHEKFLTFIAAPLIVVIVMILAAWYWFTKMIALQRDEIDRLRYKEVMLQTRERHVLISVLKGEMEENRHQTLAFISIYKNMLEELKDTSKKPGYSIIGENVQKHPLLSKTVFEINVSKLSTLDMRMAGYLSKIYASLPTEREYITLEPSTPRAHAIEIIKTVLDRAKDMLPEIESALLTLEKAEEEAAMVKSEEDQE